MDSRNRTSWIIGSTLLTVLSTYTSLTIRSRLHGYEGIEGTLTWTITSWYGILAQVTIIWLIMYVVISVIDRL